MFSFLLSSCSGAASGNGCYDWPVIKQIVWVFSEALGLLYQGLNAIGIANIGLAIIIFTLIVKCILLPLTINQQKTTKMTSVMQPELTAIQNKYKGTRDQYALQQMQAEQKAVYAKYGVNQAGGCLVSFIQFPILIALYGALRNIPTAIDQIQKPLEAIFNTINTASDAIRESITALSSSLTSTDSETVIKALYALPTDTWNSLVNIFSDAGKTADAASIVSNHATMVSYNSFLGWDLSQSPWNLLKTGTFIGILAVIIPLLAGASQWLSFKLSQAKQTAAQKASEQGNQMAATNKMMTWFMPLFSVYICFTLNIGLGIYWCMSSFFQVVLQILINRHYRKVDMDELVKQNMEKAAEKAKKKREKNGEKGEVISAAARLNTKNIDSVNQTVGRPMSIKDIANMDVSDSGNTKVKPAANSLAAKAAAVSQYNEEHPEEAPQTKKKYKK